MKVKTLHVLILYLLLTCFSACSGSNEEPGPEPEVKPNLTYALSNEIFPNPERGFMRLFPVYAEGNPLNAATLSSLRNNHITLIQRVYYLEKFKASPLSEAQLFLIQTDMDLVRQAGLKCVLRFAYTDQMSGTDAPLATIEQHLDQLKPAFAANKDVIAFVQAGFIGPWGEWHNSTNGLNTTENEKKVLFKLLDVLPTELMVQVRTPAKKQQIFGTTSPLSKELAYTAEKVARVGHHNDCFMSGGTNYGTYTNIQTEKTYISTEALYVPTGGETCPPQAGYNPNCTEGRTEMQLLKWTYLNLDYYQPTLNAWRNSGCFDEFQRNLGYRLALVDATLAAQASLNQAYKLEMNLTNKGYAPLYSQKNTWLVLKNKASGALHQVPVPVDLREVKPGTTYKISQSVSLTGIPAGDYDLFLKITDKADVLKDKPEYSVRLANTDVWVPETGLNSLKHQLKVGN
ncbi:DUF4832 domain-containing protein [Rufibacter hautae]|uniref:DUF4832 domain-containing protein n=1 Tax=Rufibacter hautae TaxID=2595005 RepID=A0A5B6TBF5_9BACT|nr:DUF4832 domain-containing protein [Rufibacter hautae]KAA3436299.1 DUF4832 domain-containing protein [Rufibacter hautae]